MGKTNIGDGDMTDLKSFKVMLGDSIKEDPKEAEKLAQLAKDLEALFDHDKTELIKQNAALAADNERLEAETTKLLYDLAQTKMELIRACAELSGIKKQEPVGTVKKFVGARAGRDTVSLDVDVPAGVTFLAGEKLYAKPKHEYNFYLSGIGTFYADSGLEITYL